MVFKIPTLREEFILVVKVSTFSPQKLRIILKDADANMPNTFYTNRVKTVDGDFTFEINVPLCGMNANLIVYNDEIGNIPAQGDNTFRVTKIFKVPLEKRRDLVDFTDPMLKSYINFCQRFCMNAGVLNSGNYVSDDKRYMIQYMPTITSSETGETLNTSARISKSDGVIQVSQEKFVSMTVPMRMIILLHEYSHFFVNNNIEDEIEADMNGLLIYLSLGYPRIEAHTAFTSAFYGAANDLNYERMQTIRKFIADFDSSQIIVY